MSETIHPSATEAERAVIGALLIDPQAVNEAVDLVRTDDFYHENHRIVFESIVSLASENRAIEIVTLADHLGGRGLLDRVGGHAALAEMARETGTSANVAAHCTLIVEKAQLRRLLEATERIRQTVVASPAPVAEILEKAEGEIFRVATQRVSREPEMVGNLLSDAFRRIEDRINAKGRLLGLASGYPDLDAMTSGFQKSDMIILAGRPSMGKTSLAVNIMEHVAIEEKKPVVFFSLEMPSSSVVMRFLASAARVPFKPILDGTVSEHHYAELAKAASRLQRSKLMIDDSSSLTPIELRSRCRRIVSRLGPIGLIVVDYLQLMNTGRRVDNRVQEVSEISRTLKGIARELGAPMIVLSQLSRAPAQRTGDAQRPQLSDLRDSGAIEQDADMVAFVHRPDYAGQGGTGQSGPAELLIRKHRNGPCGTVELVFIGEMMRFESQARDREPGPDTSVQG